MTVKLAQIDPNVRVPAAVKAAAARADEVFHQVHGEPAKDPEKKDEKPDAKKQELKEPAQEAAPVEPEAISPEVIEPKPPADEQTWEHKYKSMKGRHDRLEQQCRGLMDRIGGLEQTLASVQAQAKANETAPEPKAERFITPEEEKDYGSEFLGVVGKRAKEEMLPEMAALKNKLAQMEERLEGVGGFVSKTAQDRMFDTLDQHCGNWREINVNNDFLSWLQLPDAFSGVIRHQLLTQAFERNDSPRVLAFFKGFLAEEAAVDPASSRPDPKIEGVKPPSKISLESLAAPGRAKTAAATGAPAEKPTFTRAQIAKFYAESAAGLYRGRDEERNSIEAAIFDAQREGRIR